MLAPVPWTIANLPLADADLADAAPLHDASAAAQRRTTVDRLLGLGLHAVCQGRLTTEPGVPLSTADRTAQATLYFTPDLGNRIGLFDGTRWKLYTFAEMAQPLTTLTAGKNYDAFVYDNFGTPALSLEVWSTDTARLQNLATQDGVPVSGYTPTARYVGTIRATSATTTEDSLARRFVWNRYNRLWRPAYKTSSAGHSYDAGTSRPWNNDTAFRWEFVLGDASPVRFGIGGAHRASAAGNRCLIHNALDSTTANGDPALGGYNGSYTGQYAYTTSGGMKVVAAGYHFVQAMQLSNATPTNTYSDAYTFGEVPC